ncbi:MAG: glycosyltransferase, partial [Phycisphaerae bacterium]
MGVIVPDLVSPRYLGRGTRLPWIPRIMDEETGGVPVIRIRGLHTAIHLPGVQMRRYRRWLRRALAIYVERFGRPDVLHAMCSIPAAWACTHLADSLADRVVVTENTGPFSLVMSPKKGEAYVRSALAKAAAVVAVSEPLKEEMRAAGIDRSIQVVPNPVAEGFDGCAPPGVNTNEEGLPIFHGLFVGRLTHLKGIPELIEAAWILARDGRWVIEWNIAGDGELAMPMEAQLTGAGPRCCLKMHGLCEKVRVAELLRQSHFLILPSHGENCPLAICEALSIGRPVVTTEADGCRALVGPDEGLLAEIGDPEGLARAVDALLTDYAKWDWRLISDRARGRFSSTAVSAA